MRFQSFPTVAAGIQAQERQLHRYLGRGINTVREIVETYAPRRSRGGDNSDASVNNYIRYVARRRGISPDAPLSAADVQSVAAAMREFETGNTR